MIHLKTEKEIQVMIDGGKILKEVLDFLLSNTKEGITPKSLDKMAEKKIKSLGAEPAFKRVSGYKWSTCFSINEEVVHGIPTDYIIKKDDIVGIDCGVYYKGFNTDSAWSILVNETMEKRKFLQTGEKALEEAIKQVKIGNHIGHISQAIQNIIEKEGYSIVKSLTGHGVGRKLHEAPEIPGILSKPIEMTPKLEIGMVLALEVIYNLGSPDVVYKGDDGWTIATKDGKISGLFEKTVALKRDGVFVLT
ncbi:type I methionyl aminopeptidase [Candidatus Gottesmanbacteria bacterium RIFCSPHIGHO2_01_FULL_39_10]|uniref:Methionine aminopeptidase n=1 Tax=Candidatus Gottesmanbacteria bacterium RIFCSPHIGHO2_01_FULL_39_10 TaxID=1798375 RepID=A0A1F5ZRN6_9BACT|nr:MAG: type I methionyl aminopeptidase [Candidatus Gottesmanbacteria bacterium RIFCSPHIGHO2_01_FULL_39_10]